METRQQVLEQKWAELLDHLSDKPNGSTIQEYALFREISYGQSRDIFFVLHARGRIVMQKNGRYFLKNIKPSPTEPKAKLPVSAFRQRKIRSGILSYLSKVSNGSASVDAYSRMSRHPVEELGPIFRTLVEEGELVEREGRFFGHTVNLPPVISQDKVRKKNPAEKSELRQKRQEGLLSHILSSSAGVTIREYASLSSMKYRDAYEIFCSLEERHEITRQEKHFYHASKVSYGVQDSSSKPVYKFKSPHNDPVRDNDRRAVATDGILKEVLSYVDGGTLTTLHELMTKFNLTRGAVSQIGREGYLANMANGYIRGTEQGKTKLKQLTDPSLSKLL